MGSEKTLYTSGSLTTPRLKVRRMFIARTKVMLRKTR